MEAAWSTPKLMHGADYNPEQWLDRPDLLEQDIVLMKKAQINCVSVGIFSWVSLEPEEGVYTLDWLQNVIDCLYQNGIHTILATPSGARPAWMAHRYPEVLRVAPDLTRNRMGERHNHCYTSPVYREKVRQIILRLAGRFGNHPGVLLWHISNEYGGECFCPHCQQKFREWIADRYQTLDNLNQAWWTRFWSHTYTSWDQVEAPVPKGERAVHGLALDWQRFVTERTVDFCSWEKAAIRDGGSRLPVTTNLMTWFPQLNYYKFRDVLDVVSWDSYPEWHQPDKADWEVALETAAYHDVMRSIKRRPFLLMESTPSSVNWRPVSKLKKPGMHQLASMQAVAHGSDSVQYFQWRKSRGSMEKFHGAAISHDCREDTRVYRDVQQVGLRLAGLECLAGTVPAPRVAVVYDWENQWALEHTCGPRTGGMHYLQAVLDHYQAFWRLGISVDFVDMEGDLEGYSLVAAPMLYMYRAGFQQKLRRFVEAGGTLVGGCFSGQVDETDLCFLGDVPADMTDVYGLRWEEVDALYDGETNRMEWNGTRYTLRELCDRVHVTTASILAEYGQDFYRGEPALTVNAYGKGRAYYVTSLAEKDFYADFYETIAAEQGIPMALGGRLPTGVAATVRDGKRNLLLLQNYNSGPVDVKLESALSDVETGEVYRGTLTLASYGVLVVQPVEGEQ